MSKEIKKRDGFFKSLKKYSNNENYKKRQEELRNEPIELEKKDWPAFLISAFLTIVLPVLLILGVMIIIPLLIFGII